MKKFWIVLILLAQIVLSGCHGLVDDYSARKRRIHEISDLQWRMLVDDSDYFWLLDRSSTLTQWHPHVGQ